MAKKKNEKQIKTGAEEPEYKNGLDKFLHTDDSVISFIRDIICVLIIVGAAAGGLFLFSGTWPAVVAVESESMLPNMQVGDLVFVAAADRYGDLQTWEDSKNTGYSKFGAFTDRQGNTVYGDVIIYKPNGLSSVHPIIHRAVMWYEQNDTLNPGVPSGYITKGDNNIEIDQTGGLTGIGRIQPVQKEWVIGKAVFSIPLIGYAPLHLFEFAVIIVVIIAAYDIISQRVSENRSGRKNDSRHNKKE